MRRGVRCGFFLITPGLLGSNNAFGNRSEKLPRSYVQSVALMKCAFNKKIYNNEEACNRNLKKIKIST